MFFYATGHQPTFPSIHWNAAFVGFSGADYGAKETSLNAILPIVLVGWNTYCARILFGLTLPFLLLGPILLCLLWPQLRDDLKAKVWQPNTTIGKI
jgi:phosphatidylinositol glycan class O